MNSSAIRLPTAHLVSLATAVPGHGLPQDDVAQRAGELFAPMVADFSRLTPIYRNAEIEQRHSCVPIDWYSRPHTFGERNDLFLSNATDLLAEAGEKALAAAGLGAGDIDTVITVCSTGIATPSLDARLIGRLGLRSDVQRLPVFGLGCAGGVLGLSRAASMAKAQPQSHVLLLAVELCGLTFRAQDRSKSNIVATALFGDGAAAAVISSDRQHADMPRLGAAGEYTWPDSLDVMGWDVGDDGLKVLFSGNIPDLVRHDLRPVVERFFAANGIMADGVAGYLCHPGGAKVLDALEECFGLQRGTMRHARAVLRAHGNMSSVTVLFVLAAAMADGAHGRHLLTALGPGFTAAMQVIDLP
jgi:alkylresorcinol/alkylpyrone synthase